MKLARPNEESWKMRGRRGSRGACVWRGGDHAGLSELGSVSRVMKLVRKGRVEECVLGTTPLLPESCLSRGQRH